MRQEAPAYGFKIGRWFWPQQHSAPDPVNCVDENTSLNLCQRGPTADTLFETVFRDGGFTETLSADQAGKGRYCWGVWPIFDDPANPGTPAAGQPSVDFQLECYRPVRPCPRVNVPDGPNYSTDPNTPPPRFTHDAIAGTVELDYIPDNQMKGTVTVNGGETSQFDTSACPADGDDVGHRDVSPFSFVPQKDSTYVIDIQTFNGDQPAIADGATPVQHVVERITTGSCGETDGQCCDDRTGADPAQACGPDGKCITCGALGDVCCADRTCPLAVPKGAGQCGVAGTCELCGNPGQSCCQNIALVGNQADGCNLFIDALKGITCQGGKCEDCGDHGNACCTPDKGPFPPAKARVTSATRTLLESDPHQRLRDTSRGAESARAESLERTMPVSTIGTVSLNSGRRHRNDLSRLMPTPNGLSALGGCASFERSLTPA